MHITKKQEEEVILWRCIMAQNSQDEYTSIVDFTLIQDLLKIQGMELLMIPKKGSKRNWKRGMLHIMEGKINETFNSYINTDSFK